MVFGGIFRDFGVSIRVRKGYNMILDEAAEGGSF